MLSDLFIIAIMCEFNSEYCQIVYLHRLIKRLKELFTDYDILKRRVLFSVRFCESMTYTI